MLRRNHRQADAPALRGLFVRGLHPVGIHVEGRGRVGVTQAPCDGSDRDAGGEELSRREMSQVVQTHVPDSGVSAKTTEGKGQTIWSPRNAPVGLVAEDEGVVGERGPARLRSLPAPVPMGLDGSEKPDLTGVPPGLFGAPGRIRTCDARFRKAETRRKRRSRTVRNRKFSAGQRAHDGRERKQPDPGSSRVIGTFVGTH